MKKIFNGLLIILSFIFILSLTSCKNKKYDIISTSYVGYDFTRTILNNTNNYSNGMLLKPGEELHNYSPSIHDIENILDSKVFIYTGGESDEEWVKKDILPEIKGKYPVVINMMEIVEEKGFILNEENPDSKKSSDEYDEHIWNSLTNAKVIVEEIKNVLVSLNSDNEAIYNANYLSFVNDINILDTNINNILLGTNNRLLIFADKFPLLYFFKEYNLEYDAAFKGCSDSSLISIKTLDRLVEAIKNNNIKYIFKVELSNGVVAKTIIDELKKDNYKVEALTFYSMHNVSSKDYKNKTSYIDFWNMNLESLKKGLGA